MITFNELGLDTSVLNAISEMGFTNPTPVQEQSIPVFLETERDILALAQTGTGKTAAFGLPLLQKIDFNSKTTQALIICPTRELCLQISKDLGNYSKFIKGVNIAAVYGGSSITQQIDQLRRGAQIIVATPGRLMDLMDRKAVKIQNINFVVLDEADEMLNMGFRDDIEQILSVTPVEKRVALFSATMPKQVKQIADVYLKDPVEITVGRKNTANVNITHEYAVVHAKDKVAALKRVLDYTSDHFYGIVFCQTKNETQDISDKLIRDGYNADCLHGDLSQGQREKVMSRFRHHAIKILLATDVAARGIDVTGITHVVHYHLPDDIENYTHRSGRTARAGKTGISFTLLNMREQYRLREIEKLIGTQFKKILIPSATEVRDKKLIAFTDTIKNCEIEDSIFDKTVLDGLEPLMELSKEELVKKMLSLELRRFSDEYLNAPDLNVGERSSADRGDRASRDGGAPRERAYGSSQGTRLFVSIGQKDGLDISTLKEFITTTTGIATAEIHRVDVKGVYSFVNIDEGNVEKVMKSLHGSEFKGRQVRVEVSGNANDSGRTRSSEGGGRSYGGGGRGGYGGGDRGGRSGGGYSRGGDRGGDRGGSGERSRSSYGGGERRRSEGSGGSGGDRRRRSY
ncbi:MAG: DEAD/DEAH box helicase [Bacteroidota bacterium]